MARLSNGVFGPLAGKLGGVVFGSWKGINYGRAYVVPANPQTPSQQGQRSKMTKCIAFARPIKNTVLNRFYSFNLVQRSAFNEFVSKNLHLFGDTPTYNSIVLGQGSIQQVSMAAISYNSGSKTLSVVYDTTVEWDGLASDNIHLVAYNPATDHFDYSTGTILRSTGTITVVLENPTAGDNIRIWAIASRSVDGSVVAASTSTIATNII